MNFETSYISSACNHTPAIADWGKNNLICYGSCNTVLIYDPHLGGGKIIQNLFKHSKRVNTVKWISGADYETDLISGSSDGTAIVWSLKSNEYVPFVLEGHASSVNVVDGLYKSSISKSVIVATASVDSTVKIWTRSEGDEDFVLAQNISLGYALCLSLKLTFLPCDTLLMACAMDNSKIDLYVDNNPDQLSLVKSETLKGHDDWVRGLDFTKKGKSLLFASGGQDGVIQLFSLVQGEFNDLDMFFLESSKCNYRVIKESVITGHEGWIYSVNWSSKNCRLLSASIDKSLLIWEYNLNAEMWLETTRLGEVGGNTLGFYGAVFGPNGDSILAHSYHGAFHIWNYDEYDGCWTPVVTVGGHYDEVTDLSWEPKGEFVISVSADQTTRIHAPWRAQNEDMITWHEIARPQVHGYDLNSLAVLSRYKFASAAEEKIVRAFNAPENFIQNFRRICRIQKDEICGLETAPKGASVPSLGLSNKAVYENDNEEMAKPKGKKNPYPEESYFTAIELNRPPTEETLIQNTLWPEIQKLYGHGYEVYSLAATGDGSLLASACKATTAEHAAILIWDTSTWEHIQKLESHTLTVAQLEFSSDARHLLSVSRDRRWSVFTRCPDTDKYELMATTDKKTGVHTRIIWCCAWSHDSQYFATGSRDGKVVAWWRNENKVAEGPLGKYEAASECLNLKGEAVTALAFAPNFVQEEYLVAVGLESGFIYLYKWNRTWIKVLTMDRSTAHHLTVKRLRFRPVFGAAGAVDDESVLQLASCSSDHSLKIYDLNVCNL